MGAAAVTARVGEIQAQLASLQSGAVAPPPVPAGAGPNTFRSQLAAAASSAAPGPAALGLAAPSPLGPAAPTPVAGADTQYDGLIAAAAQRHGLDPALLKALIRQESGFDPDAGSPAGAQGLTQLMPGTAAALGVADVHDPQQSIEGGALYLRRQLDAFGGDEAKALAAYNAGPGAVARYGGVPPYPETQQYVQRVLAYAAGYRGAAAPAGGLLS